MLQSYLDIFLTFKPVSLSWWFPLTLWLGLVLISFWCSCRKQHREVRQSGRLLCDHRVSWFSQGFLRPTPWFFAGREAWFLEELDDETQSQQGPAAEFGATEPGGLTRSLRRLAIDVIRADRFRERSARVVKKRNRRLIQRMARTGQYAAPHDEHYVLWRLEQAVGQRELAFGTIAGRVALTLGAFASRTRLGDTAEQVDMIAVEPSLNWPPLNSQAMAHELIHRLQDQLDGVFSREQHIRRHEWITLEFEAHCYGSRELSGSLLLIGAVLVVALWLLCTSF